MSCPYPILLVALLGCTPGPGADELVSDSVASDTGEEPRWVGEPCDTVWYPDADGDGYGAEGQGRPACAPPSGWVSIGGDCRDTDGRAHPGADERCNGLDDDCDGELDEDFPTPMARAWPDHDGDGWGHPDEPHWSCGEDEGFADRPGDCHDGDAAIHPGAREPCNGLDDDCDGEADEACLGSCGDGVKGGRFEACEEGDAAACPGACSAHCACPSTEPGALQVHFIDVGQGDAALLVSPDGFTMLVDAGGSSACGDLEAYLDRVDLPIDYTLVSHQHSDHHGSMDDVLSSHSETVAAFDNDGDFSSSNDQAYFHSATGRRVGLVTGDLIDMGPQVEVQVLHSDTGSGNENENSVVLLVEHGSFRMLLGGDCEAGCEGRLGVSDVDVYKVHHHGASDASTDAMLAALEPLVAVIPVGLNNSYGHPSESTLYRLERYGVDVYRTDLDGDLLLESDGEGFELSGVSYR